MKRSLLMSVLLTSALFAPVTWARADCASLLPLMHAAREDTRAGRVWTPEQVATWNTWKAQCDKDIWRKRLDTIPPPADYKFVPGRSVDGYNPGDPGYDAAYDSMGHAGQNSYVPPSPSYTSCIRLANGSWSCYTTGGR
jgi:hypothetical protein